MRRNSERLTHLSAFIFISLILFSQPLWDKPTQQMNTKEVGENIFINSQPTLASGSLQLSINGSFIGETNGDNAGKVTWVGDVNADGYEDFIVASSHYDANRGKIYLFFGNGRGNFALNGSLGDSNASFVGENTGDLVGNSIARAGDVNGDGFDDILIGACGYPSGSNKGKVYVIFGNRTLGRDINLSCANLSFVGDANGDYLGEYVGGAGDVNGDGIMDLLIASYHYQSLRGKTYLFYGSRTLVGELSLSYANASFVGENSNDASGHISGWAGDINRDGFDDIVISANWYPNNGRRGKIYLIYGNRSLPNNMPLTNANASFLGENLGDEAGLDVAGAGDINRDGYDDILVSAPGYNEYAGKTYVIFGNGSLTVDTSLSLANASFIGENGYDYSGNAVTSVGDINKDGFPDIAVGAGGYQTNTGKVYIILGNISLNKNMNLGAANWSVLGENSGDAFGNNGELAGCGDYNGDGRLDLIIGAFNYPSATGKGKIYLFYGSPPMQIPSASFIGENNGDYAGYGVANVRDVNGDGFDDILISAPDFQSLRGKIYLIYGTGNGNIPANLNLANANASFLGENIGDHAGFNIAAAGDVNGDGYADFLISATDYSSSTGKVYLILGNKSMNMDTSLGAANASFIGENPNDNAGIGIACAGDVNKDGYDDFIVGADQFPNNNKQGKVYLIFGNNTISGASTLAAAATAAFTGESNDDWLGAQVAGAGDVNKDGFSDILIGACQYPGRNGKVYVIYGNSSITGTMPVNAVANASFIGENGGDMFGTSIAGVGDVNRDGYDDFLMGAAAYPAGGGRGKAYLIYGNGSLKLNTDLSMANASFVGENLVDQVGATHSLAGAGDINRDGFDDLLISGYAYPNNNLRGKVYIIFGNGSLHQNMGLGASNISFTGESLGDNYGIWVAGGGDANGDGCPDILIGAHGFNAGGNRGKVYALFDPIPPAPITDLVACNPTSESVTLYWTAPGDNGRFMGLVKNYTLKYSSNPITELNFDSAITYNHNWINFASAGDHESRVITGLSLNTKYYFALKAIDEAPNNSSISNVVNVTTIILDGSKQYNYIPTWNCTWGGNGDEDGTGIAIEVGSGNMYLTGSTNSFGGGGYDAILAKFTPGGMQLWNRTWGGLVTDQSNVVATDSNGNVYIAGQTVSYGVGDGDALLVKYDSSGNQLWNRTLDFGGGDYVNYEGLSLNPYSGDIYIAGMTNVGAGGGDAFIAKYNSSGDYLWNRTWGGESLDAASGLAVDPNTGDIFLAGYTYSYGAGSGDAFIVKYNSDGNQIFNGTWGGNGDDAAYSCALDVIQSSLYVVGLTPSFGVGGQDAFVVKYDLNGTRLWNCTWGGSLDDRAWEVDFDAYGSVFIAGDTQSFGAGDFDGLIVKFNTNGTQMWNATWGGLNADFIKDIVINDNFLYIAGCTGSIGAGGNDAFLSKYQAVEVSTNYLQGYENLSTWGSPGSGNGHFDAPAGIAINSSGFVYVMDSNNNRVQVFSESGEYITQWGSAGSEDGNFSQAAGIAVNKSGYVYVIEQLNSRVQVFDQTGQFVAKWSYGFNYPNGIALNESGFVYTLDLGNHQVQVFTQTGQFVTSWGGGPSSVDGLFNQPFGLVVNKTGFVYVADQLNNRVQVFTQTGQFVGKWGSSGSENGQFSSPKGIALDEFGNVFVTDSGNNRVQVFTQTGEFITKWGTAGSSPGQFNNPVDIEANNTNYMYVVDFYNNRIQIFEPHYQVNDVLAPVITSVGLSNGTVFGSNPPVFTLSVTEVNPDEQWYSFNGGVTNTSCEPSGSLVGWSSLDNGSVVVSFWSNDTSGNVSVCFEVLLHRDIIAPSITTTSLNSWSIYGSTAPAFTLTVVESNRDKLWYSLDGGATNTTCGMTGTLSAQWGARENGSITVTFWANDTVGNASFVTVNLWKDIIKPQLVLSGIADKSSHSEAPVFTLTCSDPNLANVWYTVGADPTKHYLSSPYSERINPAAWDAMVNDLEVTITFYASDVAGNEATVSVTITKTNSGVGLWLIIFVIGAVGGIITILFFVKRGSRNRSATLMDGQNNKIEKINHRQEKEQIKHKAEEARRKAIKEEESKREEDEVRRKATKDLESKNAELEAQRRRDLENLLQKVVKTVEDAQRQAKIAALAAESAAVEAEQALADAKAAVDETNIQNLDAAAQRASIALEKAKKEAESARKQASTARQQVEAIKKDNLEVR